MQLERPDRRAKPTEERLLICTDPDLPATESLTDYAKRWSVEPLCAAMKHQWRLKDAWHRSRQALRRWVTVLAAGCALSQILAHSDPARIPGLADPAPWRPPGTQTAGLIQAGFARILRALGLPALLAAIPENSTRPRPAQQPCHCRISAGHRSGRLTHTNRTPPLPFRRPITGSTTSPPAGKPQFLYY